MRNRTLLTSSWLSTNETLRKQLTRSRGFRAAVFFSLLALAVTSMMLSRNIMTNAQAQQAASTWTATSISPAGDAAKQNTNSKVDTPENNIIADLIEPTLPNGGAGCGWTGGTTYPITIRDQAVIGVGNNLYSFGGANAAFLANSYKFDGTTWTPITPLPVALLKASAVTDGTSVYIVNGIFVNGMDANSVNTLYRYNPAANDYTTLAPSPTATWTQPAVFLNGKIYKIGGFNTVSGTTTASNAVEVYDIAANTWSSAANYPLNIAWAAAWAQNGFVYVAGGAGSAAGSESLKTYRYDPAANTWDDAAIADLPATRWGAAFSPYYGDLELAGGTVGGVVSNSVIEWDLTSNAWTSLPNMLQARQRMAGGVAGGAFYVIGGGTSADPFTGTNDNQRLICPDPTQPFIQGSVTYVSENGTPANNTPDPGETVTVSLDLQNVGGAPTGTVTATLQATGGIVPVTTTQNYGVLAAGGAAVSRNFTFTVPANAVCGSQITLTFTVSDGTTTTNITKTYRLGVLQSIFSENFDGVTAPALPGGWTNVQTGSNTGWVTTTVTPDSAPNSAFAPDLETPGGADLTSPTVNITTASAALNFRLKYLTESTYDGGILEIKIGAGAFQEITAAGGVFTAGAYNSGVRGTGNPLGVQPGWSGNSNGYINVSINLPAAANGQAVQFKWRVGNDNSLAPAGGGLNIDNVVVNGSYQCSTVGAGTVRSRIDFDADGKTDLSVFRSGTWFVQRSAAGFTGVSWGQAGDTLVPADYNGDNKTDFAVYRAGNFYALTSDTNTFLSVQWGIATDVAVAGDFVGDARADFAVYRASTNTWYFLPNGGGAPVITSLAGTTNAFAPLALDYDGDGKSDGAQVSAGSWVIRRSTDGTLANVTFGQAGDKYVPADYDGDNLDDLAIFRDGLWAARRTATGATLFINFGAAGDVAVPGDYDGDGRDDQAVFRSGVWYLNSSTGGFQSTTFGAAGDVPVPSALTR